MTIKKQWYMWLREKGSWGIVHLLKETKNGRDITVCGMEYNSSLVKKEVNEVTNLRCSDCLAGKLNPGDLRSTMPMKL